MRMRLWETFALAVGLGMDAFSVAFGVGAGGVDLHGALRLSLGFGLFQAIMPFIGWNLGKHVISLISKYDHWVAFGLLFFIGAKMIYDSFAESEPARKGIDRTRGWTLITLSIATSIDALGAGIGMGVLGAGIALPCLIIGAVAAAMTMAGVRMGYHMSSLFGRRMETVGGAVLIGLAFKMLFTV